MDERSSRALVLGFLIGGAAVVLTLALVGLDLELLPRPWKWSSPAPAPEVLNADPASPLGGRGMVDDKQLREQQDVALRILAISPNDERAFQRLVAIRRKLSGDNLEVLRRQAQAYRQAVADGRSLEYYAPTALAFLAAANDLAAAEIERERHPQRRTPSDVPSPPSGVPSSKSTPRGP